MDTYDHINRRQLIPVVTDGLLHYKLNLGEWVKLTVWLKLWRCCYPCVEHYYKMIGNINSSNDTIGLFE